MSGERIQIRELAGWDLDDYQYRPVSFEPDTFGRCRQSHARRLVAQRSPFQTASALLKAETAALDDRLAIQASRADLQAEMADLDWSLGLVDLRLLLAFQRRLALNPSLSQNLAHSADNWSALMALSFGPPKPVVCDLIRDGTTLILRSGNPNLHFRISSDRSSPVTVHAGSPFFEVAQYRGRWFLRDGYHRAYTLLRAGIFRLPAVIVQVRTLEELGVTQPWFFPEEVLFSPSPPRVTDFLDDALILEYDRPPLIKTLRVTMEETLSPPSPLGEHL
jgi:hypothetical protein